MKEEKKMVPKLRFPWFEGEWKQNKVSDITVFHKQGYYTTEAYDDSKKYYLLRGTDLTQNRLLLKDTPKIDATEKDYELFKTQIGDFLIVRSGTVGTYGIVYEDIPAIFGSYLIDFRFDKTKIINEFFGYFYQSDLFKNQLRQIIQQSANTNINAENIKSTFINLPSLIEQQKISDLFTYIDNLITLHQQKLEKLKEYKQGMLQKMFPKEGEKQPEIRFPEFTGDWEQRKLSDIYQDIGNAFVGTATPYYVEEGHFYLESNNVKDGQINHNSEIFINDEFYEKQKEKWLHTGDMVMVQSGHVGHAAVIPKELDNSAAHALIMFRNPKSKIEPYFLNYQYQTNKSRKKIENITTGNTIKHILASDMQEFVVDVSSYEEQVRIAEYFTQIDKLITLHQRKLEKMKEYKKGLLQQMFV